MKPAGFCCLIQMLFCLLPNTGNAQLDRALNRSSFSITTTETTHRTAILTPGESVTEIIKSVAGSADPPELDPVESLQVDELEVTREGLGNFGHIRGRLTYLDYPTRKPVNWLPGILIYVAATPGKQSDWSRGLVEQEESPEDVALTAVVGVDGSFDAEIDLRRFRLGRDVKQEIQTGIALASQSGRTVTWDTKQLVIPSTVKMLEVPAAPTLPRELELMSRAAGWPDTEANGVDLIRAANALRAQGKQRALETLKKYADMVVGNPPPWMPGDEQVIFYLNRLVFEPVSLGDSLPIPSIPRFIMSREEPETPLWPFSPLELVRDVPLMIADDREVSNSDIPAMDFRWMSNMCVVRERPLVPACDPLEAAELLLSSNKFKRITGKVSKSRIWSIRRQAVNMVRDLIEPLPEESQSFHDPEEKIWQDRLAKARALQIKWNPETERFEPGRQP